MTPNNKNNNNISTTEKRHYIPPNDASDSFKNYNSNSDDSLPRWICHSPSSQSLGSLHDKDVFDMSVLTLVTPIPSPIIFPSISWCEDDEIGNSGIDVTLSSPSRENLADAGEADFTSFHRRDRSSFISRSKSRKRSLCSLDDDNHVPISPSASISCGGTCSGFWGHFVLQGSDSIDNQNNTNLHLQVHRSKWLSSEQQSNFKFYPRSDLVSYVRAKRLKSISNTFP